MIKTIKTKFVPITQVPPFSAKKTKEGWQVDILWGVSKKDQKKFERQANKCGCKVLEIDQEYSTKTIS